MSENGNLPAWRFPATEHLPCLRDQFAMAVLPAIWISTTRSLAMVADEAYLLADAMMEARKPKAEK